MLWSICNIKWTIAFIFLHRLHHNAKSLERSLSRDESFSTVPIEIHLYIFLTISVADCALYYNIYYKRFVLCITKDIKIKNSEMYKFLFHLIQHLYSINADTLQYTEKWLAIFMNLTQWRERFTYHFFIYKFKLFTSLVASVSGLLII